jgi:hypothetical protein
VTEEQWWNHESDQKGKVAGYHMHVWYNKRAITNIVALSNAIKQTIPHHL